MQKLKKLFPFALMIGASTAALIYLLHTIYTQHLAFPTGELPIQAIRTIEKAFQISFLTVGFSVAYLFLIRIRRIENAQSWLIDAVNWNVEKLKAHGLAKVRDGDERITSPIATSRWPWGNHHTETLGHLEAAARKWWVLYDPSDLTTAPTNEMVSDWLQSERNVSREKARAIASMLRPDGLPTGPRR